MPHYDLQVERKLSAAEIKKLEDNLKTLIASKGDEPTEYPKQWLTASRDGSVV